MEAKAIERLDDRPKHPDFAAHVADGGYRWWYVDGISADGSQGIVIIAFVGSVFSPYYYRARQLGRGQPENFCALNVALYRPRGSRWCMTERDGDALQRGQDWFRVGPSQLHWDSDTLTIRIHERSMPTLHAVRGTVKLHTQQLHPTAFSLDDAARHVWQPIAPVARIDVNLSKPDLQWKGSGYFDMNDGKRALESDFHSWNWSRFADDKTADIRYCANLLSGAQRDIRLSMSTDGAISCDRVESPQQLRKGLWRVDRHANLYAAPSGIRDLEDTPFYTRSLLDMPDGKHGMHEFLDMQRFTQSWVRALLPFRMPRRKTR